MFGLVVHLYLTLGWKGVDPVWSCHRVDEDGPEEARRFCSRFNISLQTIAKHLNILTSFCKTSSKLTIIIFTSQTDLNHYNLNTLQLYCKPWHFHYPDCKIHEPNWVVHNGRVPSSQGTVNHPLFRRLINWVVHNGEVPSSQGTVNHPSYRRLINWVVNNGAASSSQGTANHPLFRRLINWVVHNGAVPFSNSTVNHPSYRRLGSGTQWGQCHLHRAQSIIPHTEDWGVVHNGAVSSSQGTVNHPSYRRLINRVVHNGGSVIFTGHSQSSLIQKFDLAISQ